MASCIPQSKNKDGEYQSPIRQRLAIGGLLLCDLCRCMAIRTVAKWFPFIMLMFDPFFARPGVPKPDIVTLRLTTIPVMSEVIIHVGCVFFGIASDAWIRKTRLMFIGSLFILVGFTYISSMEFEIGVERKVKCMLHNHTDVGMPNPSCGFKHLVTAYDHPTEGIANSYFIAVALISAAHSLLDTLIPALAGDQVGSRDEVRKLYAWYYWFWKLGDTISVSICLGLIYLPGNTTGGLEEMTKSMETQFASLATRLGILVLVSATLSTLLLSVVVCSKLTREPRPDVSIIVDSWGIWKQAWQRRRERDEGEGFLSTAMYRYGGDYPDNAVKERLNLGKFFIVLLCILPTSNLDRLPSTYDYLYNSTLSDLTVNGTDYDYMDSDNINTMMLSQLYEQLTGLLVIPIIYAFFFLLSWKCNATVTLLHRLVAGQIAMVVSAVWFFLDDGRKPALILTSVFKGISNAFIWTAGYEIALFSAPRSMQATAMGMFYSIDGLTSVIKIIAIYGSDSYDPDYYYREPYYISGITLNICSIFLLILLQWKMQLGLSRG